MNNKVVVVDKEFKIFENLGLKILDNPQYNNLDALQTIYWNFHPRFRYFKTLPLNAKVLDIGAGPGGLSIWKNAKDPPRSDLQIYAIDKIKGEFYNNYVDVQLMNLDQDNIKFEDNFFDSVFLSHVIEHVKYPKKVLKEILRVLKKSGTAYIETPMPETKNFPSRTKFLEKGIEVSTLNFFDDDTHLDTFSRKELEDMILSENFSILDSGIIENKFLENQLITFGLKNKDVETTTYALWSKLRWAHYIIIEK